MSFVVTQQMDPGRHRPTPKPPPLRLLVVDDNADVLASMELLLGLTGFEVQSAPDGPTALEKAKEFHPEVVLLDIGLPGMDGYQVAAHLRQEETVKDATLIAISGYGQEEDLRLAREAGFDHHLVKPIASAELFKLLKESE